MTANTSLIDRQPADEAPAARGLHALLARLDAPIAAHPFLAMFLSAAIGLPLLLAAGFFHLAFEEGRAAGGPLAWWESQGMTLGFIGLSIAATPPAYVFTRSFVKAKLMALVACGLGGLLPLPFLLGRWVDVGKFGLTTACVAAALTLCFVALARAAAPRQRAIIAGFALAAVAIVLAAGASGSLSLWLPLGAIAWLVLPTVAMKALGD